MDSGHCAGDRSTGGARAARTHSGVIGCFRALHTRPGSCCMPGPCRALCRAAWPAAVTQSRAQLGCLKQMILINPLHKRESRLEMWVGSGRVAVAGGGGDPAGRGGAGQRPGQGAPAELTADRAILPHCLHKAHCSPPAGSAQALLLAC